MDDINEFSGDNIGGHDFFKFIPIDDVLSIPDAANYIISLDIVLKPEKDWFSGLFTRESHGYAETQQQSEAGVFYKKAITGFVPSPSPAVAAIFDDCENRRFLVVSKDNNGLYRLIGSMDEPMRLKADENSQNTTVGRAGYAVTFYLDSSFKAFYYQPVTAITNPGYPASV